MRIALFSDIHANLPAFEAFLADLDNRKVDAVYCLGDMIGYNIWPNEIIAEIRKRGIATLAGNHDQKIKGYAYELVSEANRAYLNTLPAHIKLEYLLNNNHLNIVLAHGSTSSINEYVLEDTDENYVLEMMAEAKADVLCVGHSHLPYHRVIGNKHVILVITEYGATKPEFIRFDYDVEKAALAVVNRELPAEFAERLRNAF